MNEKILLDGVALFNFIKKSHDLDKKIGEFCIKDMYEICEFLNEKLNVQNSEEKIK